MGPDISRLTAELILSRIDQDYLQQNRKRISYVRHVDDYWVGGDTIDECEKSLNLLRAGLSQFGFDINEAKTKIVDFAEVTGSYWPDDLAKQIEEIFGLQSTWNPRVRQSDVNDLFSRAINIARDTGDAAILKFLVRKMDSVSIWQENWSRVEPFLAHLAVQFPHVFDYIARVLAWAVRREVKIDRALWREVLASVAKTSADFGRDGELLWALWLYKELNYKVPRSVINAAVQNNGPLPLALAVHLRSNGLVSNPDFIEQLTDRVIDPGMYSGSDWPIVLELFKVGNERRLTAAHPLDGSLLQKPFRSGASLIRYEAYPEVFYEDREERDDDADFNDDDYFPDHAIEDFTSSYDDDEDEDEDDNDYDAYGNDIVLDDDIDF